MRVPVVGLLSRLSGVEHLSDVRCHLLQQVDFGCRRAVEPADVEGGGPGGHCPRQIGIGREIFEVGTARARGFGVTDGPLRPPVRLSGGRRG